MYLQVVIPFFLGLSSGVFSKSVRIYGGVDSDIRYYPYVVSIRHFLSNGLLCCGTIISRKHVITAAHCLAIHPSHIPLLRIYTGSSSVSSTTSENFKIDRIDQHPAFLNTMNDYEVYRHDIAIITVNKLIKFNEFQNKIELPNSEIRLGITAHMAGWGKTHDNGPLHNDILQTAFTTVLLKQECIESHSFIISYDQICVYKKKGVGICIGDSGSPLVSNGKLIGIASFGVPCAVGISDIFTNVYSCIDFIRSIVPYERV